MTIILTGGGSGGHVTPLMAVAGELKQLQPKYDLIYVGQLGDKFASIPAKSKFITESYSIRAGKFRRFHGEGIRQVFNLKVAYLNLRDAFYVIIGTYQSYKLLKRIKPDIVFSRGGFVSVPVSLGARLNHVPYITHDSDPVPSLANRLIAKKAARHAVSYPVEMYPYDQTKTINTGVPINANFKAVSPDIKAQSRLELGISPDAKMLFVIGGGLGSKIVNDAMVNIMPHLLRDFPNLTVVHSAGAKHEDELKLQYQNALGNGLSNRVKVFGFIDEVYKYSAAADLVVTRAGATNLAEFTLQGKACIIIPSSFLVGGHQLKNSQFLVEKGAALSVTEQDIEEDSNRLAKIIVELLKDDKAREDLEHKIIKYSKPNAAQDIAELIISTAK